MVKTKRIVEDEDQDLERRIVSHKKHESIKGGKFLEEEDDLEDKESWNKKYHKKRQKKEPEEYRCGNCKTMVPMESLGTYNRNHCYICLYSKHVDKSKGHRNSDCGSLMEPVGLTYKGGGELSLVHICLGCDAVDRNRIAGDDNAEMLFRVYESSLQLDDYTLNLLEAANIKLIGKEGRDAVRLQLFGKTQTY